MLHEAADSEYGRAYRSRGVPVCDGTVVANARVQRMTERSSSGALPHVPPIVRRRPDQGPLALADRAVV